MENFNSNSFVFGDGDSGTEARHRHPDNACNQNNRAMSSCGIILNMFNIVRLYLKIKSIRTSPGFSFLAGHFG